MAARKSGYFAVEVTMDAKNNSRFRHKIFYQFVVSFFALIFIMIGLVVFVTYNLLTRAGIDLRLLSELIRDEIIVGAGISAVAFVVVLLIVRHVVRPVEALSRALHQLTRGNFQTDLDIEADNQFGWAAEDIKLLRDTLYNQSLNKQNKGFVSNTRLMKPGTKADVFFDSESPHKTLINDVSQKGYILVYPLFRQDNAIEVKKGQKFKMYFYPEGARYCVIVEVEDAIYTENEKLIVLNPLSEPVSEQRRTAFRVNIECDAVVPWSMDGHPHFDNENDDEYAYNAKALNISGNGALITVNNDYSEGERVSMQLTLPWKDSPDETIDLTVEVVRNDNETAENEKRIGVRFVDVAPDVHNALTKFIMSNQQEQNKQRVGA